MKKNDIKINLPLIFIKPHVLNIGRKQKAVKRKTYYKIIMPFFIDSNLQK